MLFEGRGGYESYGSPSSMPHCCWRPPAPQNRGQRRLRVVRLALQHAPLLLVPLVDLGRFLHAPPTIRGALWSLLLACLLSFLLVAGPSSSVHAVLTIRWPGISAWLPAFVAVFSGL